MSSSRREFFKSLVALIGAGAVLPSIFGSVAGAAEERRRARPGTETKPASGTDLPLVKPGEGTAASLNYVMDHKDLKDAKLKAERQGVKWDDQHCSGCQLYTKQGMKNGEEVGSCQLFAGQLVKGKGWCSSWSKKA